LISEHFSRSEFSCACGCGRDTVDAALLTILEKIRTHFDRPVHITSGHRCEDYNRQVGGSSNSQHLHGRAADIVVQGIPASLVQELCEDLNVPGLGKYETFTHIDTRSGHARW
jgi:uncharacterized protein YcbK (DUF882 family)